MYFDEQQAALITAMTVLQTASDQLRRAEDRGFVRAVRSLRKVYQSAVQENHDYPPVPLPELKVEKRRRGNNHMPDEPGVYFIWSNNTVVYVGTARILCSRVVLGDHSHIRNGDYVSWLVFRDEAVRVCAESYYIGKLRPERNIPGMLAQWGAGRVR